MKIKRYNIYLQGCLPTSLFLIIFCICTPVNSCFNIPQHSLIILKEKQKDTQIPLLHFNDEVQIPFTCSGLAGDTYLISR